MEWWDSVILVDNLDTLKDGKIAIKDAVINTLVEHPTQMRCPSKCRSYFMSFCVYQVVCFSIAFKSTLFTAFSGSLT